MHYFNKLFKFIFLFFFSWQFSSAQVGIGTTAPRNTLDVVGSIGTAITSTTISGAITLDSTYATVLATPSSAYTITLPLASNSGRQLYTIVYNGTSGGNVITISRSGSDNITYGGVNSTTSALAGGSIVVQSDGINKWYIINNAGVTGSNNWLTIGNGNTTAGTNFIGTTDAIDFVTKTNNTEKMRVTSAGNVGIGTSTPSTLLDLGAAGTKAGTLRLAGGTSGNVTLQTSAAAGTWTMTLPNSAGASNQVLTTDGTGATTWSNPASSSGTVGVTSMTANLGPISNTQTTIATLTIPANTIKVGTIFRIKASGTGTSTGQNAATFKVFLGNTNVNTNGVNALVSYISPIAWTSGTNVPWNMEQMVTVRTIGAGGVASAIGSGTFLNYNNTGLAQATVILEQGTTPVTHANFATTSTCYLVFCFYAAAANTSAMFYNATVEMINP